MARVPDIEWIPLDIAVHAVAHVLLVPTNTAMENLLEVSRSGTVDWGRLRRPLNWFDEPERVTPDYLESVELAMDPAGILVAIPDGTTIHTDKGDARRLVIGNDALRIEEGYLFVLSRAGLIAEWPALSLNDFSKEAATIAILKTLKKEGRLVGFKQESLLNEIIQRLPKGATISLSTLKRAKLKI